MKLCRFVLLLGVFVVIANALKLVNNGYEDLRVVIQDSVEEKDQIIERIKVIFNDASELLYKATNHRTYFRSVVISVPYTWTKKSSYKTIAPFSSTTSHIRIGTGDMTTPVTIGSNSCGQKGLYTFLHYREFILKENMTRWGPHASVLLHEWGHLRWGLKDEYPTIRKGSGTIWTFQPANGEWKPVGCSRHIQGYASTTCESGIPDGKCDPTNIYNVLEKDCKFCPDLAQPLPTSIMGFQYIPSVFKFCDRDDGGTPEDERHDSVSINEQNIYCNGKSAWEVMKNHQDFKDGNSPELSGENPPPPEFILAQELSDKVRVLVLDSSGSMDSNRRMEYLYEASKLMIEIYLPEGSWLSIVDFDTTAKVIFQLEQVDVNRSRQDMVDGLPRSGDGSTCISCGLESALTVLKNFTKLDSIVESEIILISDGQNNVGNLTAAIEILENAGVVVHSIAVTEYADDRLENISRRTGGMCFAYTDNGTLSLATIMSEIISGGSVVGSSAAAVLSSNQVFASKNTPAVILFHIDEGMGKSTTVSVLSDSQMSIEIKLSGPENFKQTEIGANVKTLTLVVPGICKPGKYEALITTSEFEKTEIFVTSKPKSMGVEVIRALVQHSTYPVDFKKTDFFPVIYTHLRKGESSIKHAIVTATIYGPSGTKSCELQLLDNGNGITFSHTEPDLKTSDGIYTAFIHPGCHGGNGRHNSKVVIIGDGNTVVSFYSSTKSAVIEEDKETESATGNFERVSVPESYTVTNYDAISAAVDNTPPGRITDIEVVDVHSENDKAKWKQYYTITWTATGDNLTLGQASSYEMRISNSIYQLRHDFENTKLLNICTTTPLHSGELEKWKMVVRWEGVFNSTNFFAIVAKDENGNRGAVSNVISLIVGDSNTFEVFKEECTNNYHDSSRSISATTIAIICVCMVIFILLLLGFLLVVIKNKNKHKAEVQCKHEGAKEHRIVAHTRWINDGKSIGYHKRDDVLVTID